MLADLFSAFLLGIIEGLTEFIPVSSTGHLILFGEALEFEGRRADVFSVFIQLGAILAVVFIYPKKFTCLFDFKDKSKNFNGWAGIIRISVATLPALIAGFFCYEFIREALFGSFSVACALIFGGIVLLFIEKIYSVPKKTDREELSLMDCLIIGAFQCLALWPGVSRSGSTIVGALIVGCNKKLAAEFSFFLAVPVMIAAVGYDLYKSFSFLTPDDLAIFAVGFITSFVVAVLAIKMFIRFLENHSLVLLGVYRILLGVIVLLLLGL